MKFLLILSFIITPYWFLSLLAAWAHNADIKNKVYGRDTAKIKTWLNIAFILSASYIVWYFFAR